MTNSLWISRQLTLPAFPRGFHLITRDIEAALPEICTISAGLLHLWIKHTSASLTVNENADPTVRQDLEAYFSHHVPEDSPYFKHTYEGPDDMPAHIKSSLLGCQVCIPIADGQLQLGTWQGIMLGEHRDHGGQRKLVATIQGCTG
ncbi:secondary thiamine-phosphate synthase enzyme YjbQ [Alteromonas sp. CYL-A6]|uniref:secondary thiamine-phosphate synthase enzyme YjbQ n=1 Tax=Alteromonas nitratireducens TaxID=3390813 RepID=UPI0034AD742D